MHRGVGMAVVAALAMAGGFSQTAQAAPAAKIHQPQASSYEIRDFAAAMARNQGTAQAPQANAPASVHKPSEPGEGARALLAAFDNLNGGAESIRELSRTLSSNVTDFSPSQVVKMTMQCQQFMFQCQLTSNVANRTSDRIQQLFRQQS